MTEKSIIYLVPFADEAERYKPQKLRAHLKPTQYNENILDIKKLKYELKKDQKFLLNGNRALDQLFVKFLASYGKDVNIIQHGKHLFNSNPTSNFQTLKKVIRRYYLIMLINMIKLKFFMIFKRPKSIELKIFHFTDDFFLFFQNKYQADPNIKVKSHEVRVPDVLKWGSKSEISTVPYLKYFYVDEPIHITIGVKYREDVKTILKKIGSNEFLHVKLHPRTNKNKYKSFSQVVITDSVPKKVKSLFGYKSNLLNYDFKYENLFLFDEKLNLKLSTKSKDKFSSQAARLKYQDIHDIRFVDLL